MASCTKGVVQKNKQSKDVRKWGYTDRKKSGTTVDNTLKHQHIWGCPVHVINTRLKN